MNPLLARSMVNLCRLHHGETLVDPFCGTGGLLLEGKSLGAQIIAVELDTKTLAGAKKNIYEHGHLIKGDARQLPLRIVHKIVTDPPYGRSASTKGASLPHLIKQFLFHNSNIIEENAIICFALPSEYSLDEIMPADLYTCLERHDYFIHRSLTRKIYVLRRTSL